MVVVKLKLVNGNTEIISTDNYVVCPVKDMHPDILDVKVYVGTKVIKHSRRCFQWFYKKYLYKPLPESKQNTLKE